MIYTHYYNIPLINQNLSFSLLKFAITLRLPQDRPQLHSGTRERTNGREENREVRRGICITPQVDVISLKWETEERSGVTGRRFRYAMLYTFLPVEAENGFHKAGNP